MIKCGKRLTKIEKVSDIEKLLWLVAVARGQGMGKLIKQEIVLYEFLDLIAFEHILLKKL